MVLTASWRKSRASNPNGECVEAASGPGGVAVRDTGDRTGPVLQVSPEAWHQFLTGLK